VPTTRLRLWPAYTIGALLLLALAHIWLAADTFYSLGRQYRVLPTLGVVLLALLALLIWWVFFSRLSRRLRLAGLCVVIAAAVATGALFRVRGVTGDWVPILAFRWATPPARPVADPPPAAAVTATPASPSPPPTAAPSLAPAEARASLPAIPKVARRSGDFPQFLGPSRDGTLRGVRLARDWTATAPRRLWRQPIGEGWSGSAVMNDLLVTQEQRGDEERVVAYDLMTGRPRWSHADTARYETFIAGVGPRATPTIADGRVFAMGAGGILNALDLATGRRLWTRRVVEDNGAAFPQWGKACSPLVLGQRVIVSAGGRDGRSLVAYDVSNGDPIWSAGTGGASYSSPLVMQLAGRTQVIILNDRTFAGHDADTGALLWEHAWPPGSPNVAPPVALPGNRLLVSTGYGIGSKLFHIEPGPDGALHARMEWESTRLKSKFANIVVHGGWVYGLDDGVLICLDPATGERKWRGGRYGHGQLLLVEDLLLVQTEEGEIVLLDPSPDGPREVARFEALSGKTWNPPALAGAFLVVRNDREAAVYELPVVK
jgi:outer membrane protein assembly factor BamB